ncbi:MAG: hypothetical protein FRX48_09068 [Lasallia pustulata]|uniref:Uncharacterized protein n=1 Tax=Lasallia pustulata TaxID=136370 RepID=A0A5M8PE50_9LECA|nr:MAG: hypothetical protein FRX48_09068 [Lasallia pustulata]
MDSSPSSDKSQTRFSTPVSDLDDHRTLPNSVPRANPIDSAFRTAVTRRDTIQSNNDGRSDLLQVNEALRGGGSVSRDFEQAIVDDDRSGYPDNGVGSQRPTSPILLRRGTSRRTVPGQRETSTSPILLRRGTSRRTVPGQQERPRRSRDSSTSSRSISPPNSVDAFADPRRRDRANTIGSKVPSDIDLTVHQALSEGTHRRCRTFSNGSVRPMDHRDENGSIHDPAEEDVCFPQSEVDEPYTIDFEALEEFVAESTGRRTVGPCHYSQRLSFSSQSQQPKNSNDLGPNARQDILHVITRAVNPPRRDLDESPVDDVKIILDEKASDDTLAANEPLDKAHEGHRLSMVEPNRYSFFSSELEQTVHATELGHLLMPGQTFRDLFELPPDSGVWWLDVFNPSEDEVEALAKAFSIHPLTREDITMQEAREKVELFKQYYFVCFRSFSQMDKTSEDYLEPLHVYMVVFRGGIVTFTFSPSPHAANVRKRIGRLRDYMALTADWICYAMIDNIVDTFGPVITSIELETDQIEDQVFVARADDFSSLLRQIGECRKKVMSLMRLLGGKADVIKGFAKRCNSNYKVTPRGEIGLYLGDIQDHVVTMMSNLGHFEKMLGRSHSNYLAQLSVDNIAQGNRANRVLSKITLIATILVPLNLITGLFGMNVPVPGRESGGLGWFFGIIGTIGVFILVFVTIARRLRLLGD